MSQVALGQTVLLYACIKTTHKCCKIHYTKPSLFSILAEKTGKAMHHAVMASQVAGRAQVVLTTMYTLPHCPIYPLFTTYVAQQRREAVSFYEWSKGTERHQFQQILFTMSKYM